MGDDELPRVCSDALPDRIGLASVVVRGIELRPREREQQREAVRDQHALPVGAVEQAADGAARGYEVDAALRDADARAEEVVAAVKVAALERVVPHTFDHPPVAPLH